MRSYGRSKQVNILNDDVMAELSIDDTSLFERDYETTMALFKVQLNLASPVGVVADFVTASGTATEGSDFAHTAGTVRIPAGSRVATIEVPVFGDTRDENNENFSVKLSNVRGSYSGKNLRRWNDLE